MSMDSVLCCEVSLVAEEWLSYLAGLATQAVPLYLSEIAPVQIRGQLNIMFQLSITIGILVAQIINYCACTTLAKCSPAKCRYSCADT